MQLAHGGGHDEAEMVGVGFGSNCNRENKNKTTTVGEACVFCTQNFFNS
jgi:hypothetical protein